MTNTTIKRRRRPACSALDRIVMKEAHRVRRAIPARAIEFEELVGFGYVGMVEAQSRFENSRGTNIETFARYRIRGAIMDGVRQSLGVTRRRAYEKLRLTVGSVGISQTSVESEHTPKDDTQPAVNETVQPDSGSEGACSTGSQTPDCKGSHEDAMNYAHRLMVIDAQLKRPPSPEQLAAKRDAIKRMQQALTALSADERAVLDAVYDLRDTNDSGARLAARWGVHRSSISRRHKMVILKLRDLMAHDARKAPA